MLERPPINWSQPIRWNTGEPAQAEWEWGHVLINFDEDHPAPKDLLPWIATKCFKDSVVVYQDTGYCMGWECYDTWIENVAVEPHPIAAIAGTF